VARGSSTRSVVRGALLLVIHSRTAFNEVADGGDDAGEVA
jgi:hypothetical protein